MRLRSFILSLALLARLCAAASPQALDVASWHGQRLMVITAHPDDVEGFAAGLVAYIQANNASLNIQIQYLIITSGNAGGKCYNETYPLALVDCSKEDIAALRARETTAAAAFLGVEYVRRMGLDDGMSIAAHETRIRRVIAAHVRDFRPHIVLTHAPVPNWDAPPTCNGLCSPPSSWDDLGYHPDHQFVGQMVFHTLYGGGSAADNAKLFPDLNACGVTPWKIHQLYFFALTEKPMTHFLVLNNSLIDTKARALAMHYSQYGGETPTEFVLWLAQQAGGAVGHPLAEGYQAWF